jgi:hypothetical protein
MADFLDFDKVVIGIMEWSSRSKERRSHEDEEQPHQERAAESRGGSRPYG